jgi:hypothetical protein
MAHHRWVLNELEAAPGVRSFGTRERVTSAADPRCLKLNTVSAGTAVLGARDLPGDPIRCQGRVTAAESLLRKRGGSGLIAIDVVGDRSCSK